MQRRMMAMIALMTMMALAMAVGPKTTKAMAQVNFGCHITGENGYQWCKGSISVPPGEVVTVCLDATTHGYSGGFYLSSGGIQRGNAVTLQPGGPCANLWTNNTGAWVTVDLFIDSQSYYWDQVFSGRIF
jgi:hypothetical protein